jgi:signal transduction histidine kinase
VLDFALNNDHASSMRRRVLTAIMSVTTIVVLLFAVPLGFVLERLLDERAVFALEHHADVAARNIDLTDPNDLPDETEFPKGPEKFALYDPAGKLVSGAGPQTIQNHAKTPGSPAPSRLTAEEGPNLVTTLPIMSGEATLGFLRAQRSMSAIDAKTTRTLALLIAGVLSVLTIGWFIALRLARTIATSTETLRDSAVRLGSGDFTTTATATGIRELDDVGEALTSTARKLGELVDREHAFSADASHQLRTPIAGLRAALETELAFPRDDRTIIVRESLDDVERFENTVNDILSFARSEIFAQATTIDVTELVRNVHRSWLPKFVGAHRSLSLSTGTTQCPAVGNVRLLSQALDALVDNALKHGAGATCLGVTIDDASVTIHVTDSGPRSNGSRASDGSRLGLGLALAHRLVSAQGGRLISALNEPLPSMRVVLLRARGASQSDGDAEH